MHFNLQAWQPLGEPIAFAEAPQPRLAATKLAPRHIMALAGCTALCVAPFVGIAFEDWGAAAIAAGIGTMLVSVASMMIPAAGTMSRSRDVVDQSLFNYMKTQNYLLTARISELEAALHKINSLIDSPARFNAEVQAVLDSVIDTSDTKFEKT